MKVKLEAPALSPDHDKVKNSSGNTQTTNLLLQRSKYEYRARSREETSDVRRDNSIQRIKGSAEGRKQ